MVIEEVTGQSWHRFLMDPELCFSTSEYTRFQELLSGLQSGIPIQYLLGKAWFAGLQLEVGQGVLIPRPETEELVEWAVQLLNGISSPQLLDLCTGSGCIPLALKNRLPNAKIMGVDNSPQALNFSKKNAERLELDIKWIQMDLLIPADNSFSGMDLITCNPPYIPESEFSEMSGNVTGHEPKEALFVPDSDPLIFYRTVSASAIPWLKPGGRLLFEIHEQFAQEVKQAMVAAGFDGIEIRKDMQGKDRMVMGRKPGELQPRG